MNKTRIFIFVLTFISMFVIKASVSLAEDTTPDDWVTNGGGVTYIPSGKVEIGKARTGNTDASHPAGAGHVLYSGISGSYTFLGAQGNDNVMVLQGNGNIGIGTPSPGNRLDIKGVGSTYYATEGLRISGGPYTAYTELVAVDAIEGTHSQYYQQFKIKMKRNNDASVLDAMDIRRSTNTIKVLFPNGNVGIGTTSPGVGIKLDVVGKVRAHEIIVNLDNPADFVFEENYMLPTLNQVETFIKENRHLPNIPSGKEIKENGIGVSEMIAKQMQKIEELTLYVIEQNKEIKELKKKVAELE